MGEICLLDAIKNDSGEHELTVCGKPAVDYVTLPMPSLRLGFFRSEKCEAIRCTWQASMVVTLDGSPSRMDFYDLFNYPIAEIVLWFFEVGAEVTKIFKWL